MADAGATKLVTFFRATNASDRVRLRRHLAEDGVAAALAGVDGVARILVNTVDVVPSVVAWQRPGEPATVPAEPAFDAVAEVRLDDPALADDVARRLAAAPAVPAGAWSYLCAEAVEKDSQPGVPPAVKYMAQITFHDDLPDSAARRSWAQHVPLALRVHVGMCKYVRNWVVRTIGADAPRAQGIVELHFPTLADLHERWFVDERGRQEIIQDVGHFLKGATRLFTTEHVVRG